MIASGEIEPEEAMYLMEMANWEETTTDDETCDSPDDSDDSDASYDSEDDDPLDFDESELAEICLLAGKVAPPEICGFR